MARTTPEDAFGPVLEAIAQFPEGASIEQIERGLTASASRRTLASASVIPPSSNPWAAPIPSVCGTGITLSKLYQPWSAKN